MKKNIKSLRQLRVGQQLKHLISEVIIMGDFQSERVRETPITVTEVSVSPNLKKAHVFVISRDRKKNFIKYSGCSIEYNILYTQRNKVYNLEKSNK